MMELRGKRSSLAAPPPPSPPIPLSQNSWLDALGIAL
jgi:hypothetical protein